MTAAVLGHISEAQGNGLGGRLRGDAFPVEENFSGVRRGQTKECAGQFGPAGADQPGQSEDLAGANREAHPPHSGSGARHVAQLQHGLTRLGLGRRIKLGHLTTNHELDQPGLGDGAHRLRAHTFAVAQHGDPIGQGENFLQPVRNVDDTHAAGAQLPHHGKQPLLFAIGQRGGGLVHDDDARAGTDGAGDFDQLLLGHRKRTNLGVRGDGGTDAGEQLFGALAARPPVNPPCGPGGLQPEPDIFRDREVGEKRGLLVDTCDAQLLGEGRRQSVQRPSRHRDLPGIRLVRPGDDFDERAFARTILAEQGMHLAGLQVEIHAPQRPHAAEAFRGATQGQEWGGGRVARHHAVIVRDWSGGFASWHAQTTITRPDISPRRFRVEGLSPDGPRLVRRPALQGHYPGDCLRMFISFGSNAPELVPGIVTCIGVYLCSSVVSD